VEGGPAIKDTLDVVRIRFMAKNFVRERYNGVGSKQATQQRASRRASGASQTAVVEEDASARAVAETVYLSGLIGPRIEFLIRPSRLHPAPDLRRVRRWSSVSEDNATPISVEAGHGMGEGVVPFGYFKADEMSPIR